MSPEPLRVAGRPVRVRTLELGPRTSLEALLQRARELGFARGQAQGAAGQREQALRALDAACERLDAFREQARADLARTAAELAVEIARRLLRCELARGSVDLERLVRETLQAASTERGRCVVHLNPADHAALRERPFRAGTELCADVEVARGDVHVETALGLLVRELDGALDSLAERLAEELS